MEKYSGIPKTEEPQSPELVEIREKSIDVKDALFEVQHLFEKFGIPMNMTFVKTIVKTMDDIEAHAKNHLEGKPPEKV